MSIFAPSEPIYPSICSQHQLALTLLILIIDSVDKLITHLCYWQVIDENFSQAPVWIVVTIAKQHQKYQSGISRSE
jgi:hypothetical protein